MKKYFFLFPIVLFCFSSEFCFAQKSHDFDSFWIYDSCQTTKGMTTMMAIGYADQIEKENHRKIFQDTASFNLLLRRAQVKRHHQTKLPSGVIHLWCGALQGQTLHEMLILRDMKPYLVIDLTERKNFWISNEEDIKWLDRLKY